MIRLATAPAAAALTLALALAGCATPAAQNRDVVAVVQDEQGRQAVAQALDEGKTADQALDRASEARAPAPDPPH